MFVTRYVPNQYDYLTFPPMSTNLNMTIEIKRRHFIVIILIIIVPVSLSSEASIQALARTSFSSGNHLVPCGIFSAVGVKWTLLLASNEAIYWRCSIYWRRSVVLETFSWSDRLYWVFHFGRNTSRAWLRNLCSVCEEPPRRQRETRIEKVRVRSNKFYV